MYFCCKQLSFPGTASEASQGLTEVGFRSVLRLLTAHLFPQDGLLCPCGRQDPNFPEIFSFLFEYAGDIFPFIRRMKSTQLDLFSIWEQEINFENDLNLLPGGGLPPSEVQ